MNEIFLTDPDWHNAYKDNLQQPELLRLRNAWLEQPKNQRYSAIFDKIVAAEPLSVDARSNIVKIGDKAELDSLPFDLEGALRSFMPWKKGPFDICGHEIDAEWRSDLKWDRMAQSFPELKGKKVLDIGAHNGYFMFRMLEQQPELICGIEPVASPFWAFQFMQQLTKVKRLVMEPLGVENVGLFQQFFDVVFCLGIIYHQRDPVGMLRSIARAMKPGGELVLETMGIPGDDAMALVPSGRYARAKGVWFVPMRNTVTNWLRRSYFEEIECFCQEKLTVGEQRRTPWAPIDSLEDFLSEDQEKTQEGYPAPDRIFFRAKRSRSLGSG
jgi:tRNA (mo5U34)-methyltransferase